MPDCGKEGGRSEGNGRVAAAAESRAEREGVRELRKTETSVGSGELGLAKAAKEVTAVQKDEGEQTQDEEEMSQQKDVAGEDLQATKEDETLFCGFFLFFFFCFFVFCFSTEKDNSKQRCGPDLQTPSTTTTLAACGIGGNGGHVLNAADLDARASKGAEGRLGTRAGGLGAISTGGTDLDVKGSDSQLLAALSNVLSGQHGSVRGGLITISLDLHSTSDTGDGFTAGEISHVLYTHTFIWW